MASSVRQRQLLAGEVSVRPTRADARRNRELIFAAARACFACETSSTGMEDIARRAGVGVGSLYRAFGNRAGLAAALYREMLDELAVVASELETRSDAWEALLAWLKTYVEALIAKQSIMKELRPLFDHDPDLATNSHKFAADAFSGVLARAQRAGTVRMDIEPADLLRLVFGMVEHGPAARDRIDLMLNVILTGIRTDRAS